MQDMLHIGPAPGINALGVVAHSHQAAALAATQQAYDFILRGVGVLVLIYQDMPESFLQRGADVGVFAE